MGDYRRAAHPLTCAKTIADVLSAYGIIGQCAVVVVGSIVRHTRNGGDLKEAARDILVRVAPLISEDLFDAAYRALDDARQKYGGEFSLAAHQEFTGHIWFFGHPKRRPIPKDTEDLKRILDILPV
jgi:hypothetical protein